MSAFLIKFSIPNKSKNATKYSILFLHEYLIRVYVYPRFYFFQYIFSHIKFSFFDYNFHFDSFLWNQNKPPYAHCNKSGVRQKNMSVHIRKTCPCKVYPLIPLFYIVKLGYAGVYLFFLFLLQNIDCGYSLEPPRRGGSNVYPQSMF